MHMTDATLRAYVDNELPEAERRAVAAHVAECAECRSLAETVQRRAEHAQARLRVLAPTAAETVSPQLAYSQFKRKELSSMWSKLFSRRSRPLWAGLSLVAVLTLALSFEPVRVWAGDFLGLFRVQQITVLPLDTTQLSLINNNSTLANRLSQMFSDAVVTKRSPGDPQIVASPAEASSLVGFTVRSAEFSSAPEISVQTGMAFEVTVDRARAQAILADLGHPDLSLPESLDGATIAVDVPAGASLLYGDCPRTPGASEEGPRRSRPDGASLRNCFVLVQVASPVVSAPPDVDFAQVAAIGLQVAGMSADEAQTFSASVDWTSTLVVPLPSSDATYEPITVDGVSGNLIRQKDNPRGAYFLLWVKDGIVYSLTGYGDAAQGMALANSLH